jgi:hypothetical protein
MRLSRRSSTNGPFFDERDIDLPLYRPGYRFLRRRRTMSRSDGLRFLRVG